MCYIMLPRVFADLLYRALLLSYNRSVFYLLQYLPHRLSKYEGRTCGSGSYLTSPQDSGNKVSRRAAITGTANITLGGRTVIMADVQLRGDLRPMRSAPSQSGRETTPVSINIGRCTVISTGSVIKPPARISRGQVHYYPMKIGDNVFVGTYFVILLLWVVHLLFRSWN